MKILFLAWLSSTTALAAQTAVPDFILEAYRGNAKLPLVGVLLKSPPKHHFNINAPMSAKTVATSIDLKPTAMASHEIRFEVEDASITPQDSVEVSAYLCDDAKTFCIKKTGTIGLASASVNAASVNAPNVPRNKIMRPDAEVTNAKVATTPAPSAASVAPIAPVVPAATPKKRISKDEHGFWNDIESAQKEAQKMGKPLMIDFFGIWCPPCQMFVENVFPTARFKQMAKNFVLLKVDVDQAESWQLKSRYKIGGYPTIVFAKPTLEEIDRAVGYFPPAEFVARMRDAYEHRTLQFEDRVQADKARYLRGLQDLVELKYEQRDFKEALRYAQEGLISKPGDRFFKLMEITLKSKDEPRVIKQADHQSFLKSVWENRKTATALELLRFQDLMVGHAETLSSEQVLWGADAVDELKTRVNSNTLQLEGQEMSVADLDAMRVDLFENAKKEDRMKQAVKDTIASYQRLMKLYHGEKSRGLNLELAYYLGKDGQVAEATKIYEDFMKRYPKEFTYYFAAARHYQEVVKDLKRARECADSALQYSYGDNRLRSMARLLSIRAAQGEVAAGIEQAKQVLAQVPSYDGLSVRTGRYVTALEKAIETAKNGSKK